MENKDLIVGLDSNVLCYALDPAYAEHEQVRDLLLNLSPENSVALNPTVLHEAYHVLVFYLQWFPQDAAERLLLLLRHPNVKFYNQTKRTSEVALNLATKFSLGGRAALMLASFLANRVPVVYTHDQALVRLGEISWKNMHLSFQDPLTK